MERINLDYNATTPVNPEVVEAMLPYFTRVFGNPSSVHTFGQEAKKGMEEARERLARLINAAPGEIVFTGGGTAADNLAIKGIARTRRGKGNHLITSSIEHHAVFNTCRHLEGEGFVVTFLPVDRSGMVDPAEVKRAIRPETILISIMHGNNEVGTIQPLEEIGRIARERGICFHSDAVQSLGKIPVDVEALGVDLLSLSAHKIYGPKGVGALYVRKGVDLEPILHGGHHEMNRRAGTENVPGIVGFGKAAELAAEGLEERRKATEKLRNYFLESLQERVRYVRLNGHPLKRLPNTLNVLFEYVEEDTFAPSLDLSGLAVSAGSACTSGAVDPSHVLLAMGVPGGLARGSLRISLGTGTTREEVDRAVAILAATVDRFRSRSPFFSASANVVPRQAS